MSAVLAERGTSLTDEEVTLASLQLLALIQRSNQIPVGLERAVPPFMAMVKEREDVGILGNILAALTALASRSHPPECDMSGEAFRLGAIEDIERLLERAAKMEAEGAVRPGGGVTASNEDRRVSLPTLCNGTPCNATW